MKNSATANTYLSLTQLLVERAHEFKDSFILGVPDKNLKITSYTYGQIELAVNLLATHYATVLTPRAKGDAATKLTVALLAPSGYDYVITELALSRIGYTVLFVSVNNSAEATAHLCKETGSTALFVAPQYQKVADESIQFLPEGYKLEVLPLADSGVYGAEAQAKNPTCVYERALTPAEEAPLICFIVHSSGSTGFPKPIYTTHSAFVFNIAGNFGLQGFTTLPLYHNHGHSCLYRAFHSNKPLWLFPASDLPLTTSNVLGILEQPEVHAQALYGVPYVYKLLGESPEGIKKLQAFELCLFGGSAMPSELGDQLVDAGIKLVGHYGSTETGQLMTSFRDYETDKEWEWNRVSDQLAPFVKFEERDEGRWEIVVLDGWKGKVVKNRPDGSYAMSDLFVKHPSRPNLFKFVGRIDDTLVLMNGEKVNPVPIELALKQDPAISEAIVFGAERTQAGAIILLSENADPKLSREATLALIAPAVKFANAAAPTHSRLSEELIILLPFGTAIPRADKGSFIRRKVYVAFKEQIDRAYAALEGDDGVDEKEKKKVGSVEEMEAHIFKLVKDVSGSDVGLKKDTDLFTFGLDSLAAGRIRNSLQRDFNLSGHKLSTNFVFENPSVELSAAFIVAVASGKKIKELTQVEQMTAMVEKYRRFNIIPTRHAKDATSVPSLAVVVLTGATGSLGANILAALLKNPSVKKVYNLVRGKDDADATKRVKASMADKGLAIGDDPRVISLASDFAEENLGLTAARYAEIAKEVTCILHNAWSVNFNLSMSSFEPHVRGACNFIKLQLDSDYLASFYFASSVSAVASWPGPGNVPEAVTPDPETAQDMGYARSKWVTEKLCQIASETTPARAVVLRIGQMVGSTLDGRWNETEAVTLIFKSADTIRALPALPETPSWLPVDVAADSILELATLPAPPLHTSQVWHVMQPKTIPYSSVLDSLEANGMKFERVNPQEWVRRLRTGPQDPNINPTIKLLTFFENKYDHPPGEDTVVKRFPLTCDETLAASKHLREAPLVDAELMGKFVERWRATGFLAPAKA
ncbi:hypothetical protein MNV49_005208 [Pseudohyphozyma bogoriensis]|nr:hypothetical protein MNV49_005208 [Pseudohyphozyma bogoriensis]